MKFCQKYDITVVGYTPLGNPSRPLGKKDEKNILEDPVVAEIAKNQGKTSAQIALAWNMQRDVVVIPKSSKLTRAQENFDSQFITLTEDEINQINELECNLKVFDPVGWDFWDYIPLFK